MFSLKDKRVLAARSCSDEIRSVFRIKYYSMRKTQLKMNNMIVLYNSIINILTNNSTVDDDDGGMLH
jgi:hypothetical protein